MEKINSKQLDINRVIDNSSYYVEYPYGYFTEDEKEFMLRNNINMVNFYINLSQRLVDIALSEKPSLILNFEPTKENILLSLNSISEKEIYPRWTLNINFEQYIKERDENDRIWLDIFEKLKFLGVIDDIKLYNMDITQAIKNTKNKLNREGVEMHGRNYIMNGLNKIKENIDHIKNIEPGLQTDNIIKYVLSHKDSKMYLKYLRKTPEVLRRINLLEDISSIPYENQTYDLVNRSVRENPFNLMYANPNLVDIEMLEYCLDNSNFDIIPYIEDNLYTKDICIKLIKKDRNNIFMIPPRFIDSDIINLVTLYGKHSKIYNSDSSSSI